MLSKVRLLLQRLVNNSRLSQHSYQIQSQIQCDKLEFHSFHTHTVIQPQFQKQRDRQTRLKLSFRRLANTFKFAGNLTDSPSCTCTSALKSKNSSSSTYSTLCPQLELHYPAYRHNAIGSRKLATAAGKITVHFLFADGKRKTVEAKQGSNLLDVVIDHDIDIDGFGACEGTLACSTCHVILPQDVYDKLPPPVDEELDMLDLAYELTDSSRLGCQVVLTKDLDGLEVTVPVGVADARG